MDTLDTAASPSTVPSGRVWLARGVAVLADLVQVGGFAVTAEGALSPVDDVLDVVTAVVLTLLVGWHMAFIPSFIVKLLPVADLAPTWTIAVLVATAGRSKATPLAPVPMLPASDPGGRRSGRAAVARAVAWFAVLFAIGFAVGQLFLMPHLPPVLGHVPAGATGPWRQNWAGAVLGGAIGLTAARTVLRRAGRA